jgi:hypothetical protein
VTVIDRKNMPRTIELLVAESDKRAKALRKFIAWFDTAERTWDDEFRDDPEFFDLRDAYDAAKDALR